MERMIRGVGDVKIQGVLLCHAEYQLRVVEGVNGLRLEGALSGSPRHLYELGTGAEVTLHPPHPKTAFKIQADSYSAGSKIIAITAWPLDPSISPESII